MLQIIWQSAGEVFAHKAVSDYLFPVVSGVFLTFFTANLIRFQEMKKQFAEEVLNVRKEVFAGEAREPIKVATSGFAWAHRLQILASRLRAQDHTRAAEVVAAFGLKIGKSLHDVGLAAHGTWSEGKVEFSGKFHTGKDAELYRQVKLIHQLGSCCDAADAEIEAVSEKLKPSWPALFEIPNFCSWTRLQANIRRHWLRVVVCPTCYGALVKVK